MRFKLQITRIQVAERTIAAANEKAAIEQVREDLSRPYGLLGAWKDGGYEVEVVDTEVRHEPKDAELPTGRLAFSVQEAAELMGLSRASLYNLIGSGEIEHVKIGRRVLISRAALEEFITTHSRRGYYQ